MAALFLMPTAVHNSLYHPFCWIIHEILGIILTLLAIVNQTRAEEDRGVFISKLVVQST